MPAAVSLLCAITSLTSAILLWRALRPGGSRLLFWSSLCFFGMAIHNALLATDFLTGPGIDIRWTSSLVSLVSTMLLTYGLVWDAT